MAAVECRLTSLKQFFLSVEFVTEEKFQKEVQMYDLFLWDSALLRDLETTLLTDLGLVKFVYGISWN